MHFLILLLPVLAVIVGCSRSEAGGPRAANRGPVPVVLATAEQMDIPVELRSIARVEAYRTVTVKPQISGKIVAIAFEEGQDVNQGDLLVSIDSRPFEAAVRQAEGVLAKDVALADDAAIEAARQTGLREQGVAAQREYETAIANAAALAATVAADRAALDQARLNLEYCSIRAPISGRTGARLADVGNVVKANEAELVVLNQLNPIYVTFSVPEQRLGEIRRRWSESPLPVEAEIPEDAGPREVGELTFIDNRVDQTTGMIMLKGTFANQSRRLWPGQYVNAVLTVSLLHEAVVVPTQAIQVGQSGEFIYVVHDDDTVESRPVQPGIVRDGRTVITKGVEAGERVVTDGQLRLVPGAKVQEKGAKLAGSQPASTEPAGSQP